MVILYLKTDSKFVKIKSANFKTHIEDINHFESAIDDQFSIDTPPDNPNIKWKIEKTSTRIWVDPDEETVDINYLGMPWLELHYTQEGWNVLDTISQIPSANPIFGAISTEPFIM